MAGARSDVVVGGSSPAGVVVSLVQAEHTRASAASAAAVLLNGDPLMTPPSEGPQAALSNPRTRCCRRM